MLNFIPHFIAEKFSKNEFQGSFQGTAIFLDISGFTQMTERLMQKGKEGAEILAKIINNIFEPVIESVYQAGGFISTFAGDAFTAIFPSDKNNLNGIYTAEKIRNIFEKSGKQITKFGDFELSIKIGLSYGAIEWGIIGSKNQKTYYFKGEAIEGAVKAEHLCEKMEIILDSKILKFANPQFELLPINENYSKLIKSNLQIKLESKKIEQIPEEILKLFISDHILHFNQQGEFREVISVFISFKDYELGKSFDSFIDEVLSTTTLQGGYFNKIDFGDKGGVILILFGAPISHENNLIRALNFITHIRNNFNSIKAGITLGIAYCGLIGSRNRAEYTALGDIVNQSSRFMTKADWDEIWISDTIEKKINKIFQLENLGKMKFKGKNEEIQVYKLKQKILNIESNFFQNKMVGREEELSLLEKYAEPLANKKFAGIVIIYGEAGMGKSRLAYEFTKLQKNAQIIVMQTDNILKISMNPFKYFLNNYFDQIDIKDYEPKKKNFEEIFNNLLINLEDLNDIRTKEIINELKRTKSILSAQIEIFYENSLYEELDPKERYENTLFAYKELFKAISLIKPVILQIEDIHWLDDDSHKVFQTLCRNIDDFPIMILGTSRFNDDGSKPKILVDNNVLQYEIVLNKLEESAANMFIEQQLEGKVEQNLLEQIKNKTEFNPFYIEQFISYLKENDLLMKENDIYKIKNPNFEIPSSVKAIIIARIDRLENELKNIVQIASVLGREVELNILLALLELYQSKTGNLKEYFDKIEEQDLWINIEQIKYIFKHALLHEVIYEMQLKERLRNLHNLVAQKMKEIYSEEYKEKYYEIAKHYDKAENWTEALIYYQKAGEYYQNNYENTKAFECFNRYLEIAQKINIDLKSLINIYKNRGRILEIIGKWDEAKEDYIKGIEIAEKTKDENQLIELQCELGNLLINKGQYKDALELFENAKLKAENMENKKLLANTLKDMGNIYHNLGNFDKAINFIIAAQKIYLELGDKIGYSKALTNMGQVYHKLEKYEKALECYNESLKNFSELNDKASYTRALNNTGSAYSRLGKIDKAMSCFLDAMQLYSELGNKSGYASIIGNIGIIHYENKNYSKALEYYEEQKKICLELGDQNGYAVVLCNLGNLHFTLRDFNKSLECYNLSTQVFKELGAKREYSIVLTNKGELYKSLENFDKTIECYNEVKQIYLELGLKQRYIKTLTNIGDIYREQKIYEKAIEYYNEAIDFCNNSQIKNYSCYSLYSKALLHFILKEYDKSKSLNNEALIFANELKDEDIIILSTILKYKLTALENKDEALFNLNQLLSNTSNEEHQAYLYYEIYKINKCDEYREKALEKFQIVYNKTPYIEYKNIIGELTV